MGHFIGFFRRHFCCSLTIPSPTAGYFAECWTPDDSEFSDWGCVSQVPLRVIKTGKTDLKHNSSSFLTLITKLQVIRCSTFTERQMQNDEWLWSLVKRVRKLSESGSIQGRCTEKSDLKLDSLRFLTLITKLQSHSAFCKVPLPLPEVQFLLAAKMAPNAIEF